MKAIPSLPELEELLLGTLSAVLSEDVDELRATLLARGAAMPADSYQLLEVMMRIQTTLGVDFDITKFEGFLSSIKRAARKLRDVILVNAKDAA